MFEKCLYFNSNALARTVSRIWTEAYKEFDLSPPHAFLVRLVLSNPGILPREIAEELSLSRSTVTRFLDSLEKKGFLERKTMSSDGREVQVYPTPQAMKIHDGLVKTKESLMIKMGALFGENELLETVGKLRDVRNKLEK